MDRIQIRGARTHNLKNIDLDLPRNRLTVFTGLSGSGKSSLAFDTIYAEGQRRYVESLSAYARQFLSVMDKPDVDHIEGLSPAISIEQKSTSHNPRSTVGTITEIHDYLRLLFARVGVPHCPTHGQPLRARTVSEMVDQVLALPEGEKLLLLAPVVRGRKGSHQNVIEELRAQGYVRVRLNGEVHELDQLQELDPKLNHDLDVVVDRFKVREDLGLRLAESFETALGLSSGLAVIAPMNADSTVGEFLLSANFACPHCGFAIAELEPRLFSFNSPQGACGQCGGLGVEHFFDPDRVIAHPELSLAGGAVRGWDRRNAYYFGMVKSLARHYGFDVDTPFEQLSDAARDAILHGSGEEIIEFHYISSKGREEIRRHRFEGVLPNMARRYRETDSNVVREELAKYQATRVCPHCEGTRLNAGARNVQLEGMNLPALSALAVGRAAQWFEELRLEGQRGEVGARIISEICARLRFLINVGLDYLSLDRNANTLSGGESQRIRLASQIGAGLVGVMYVLDEPSIGLHQRDNERLLTTLCHLRDLGNTVIVVEHDEDTIRAADHVVDIGPGAGVHGGSIIASGTAEQISANPDSLTGQYLSGRSRIPIPLVRTPPDAKKQLRINGARGHNLKALDATIPIGLITCVTGVSGSGKSTLINDTLYAVAAHALNGASTEPAEVESVTGLEHLDKVVDIDQSPIGRTPRSNPATYTGLFTTIRELFAGTQEARSRGYKAGRFSFNVKGGRCEACQGDGLIKVEMHFLPDVYVPCDVCKGKRYNRETLGVHYKGKNIHEVLTMTVEEALPFFQPVPPIHRKLETLNEVGLGYVALGQAATTLSGGEAQRVKLARELSKRDTGRTLYILDEPTSGLHFHDIKHLLDVLHRLRDRGNTIVVIEHNLDVIKTADWILDLGPEGGDKGGTLIHAAPPEEIAIHPESHTGRFLKRLLPGFDEAAGS